LTYDLQSMSNRSHRGFTKELPMQRMTLRPWLSKLDDVARKYRAGALRVNNTPEHLLSDADLDSGMVRIDTMDEHAYEKSVHLDAARPAKFCRAKGGLWIVDFRDLPQIAARIRTPERPGLHLISHPGFCGSTLMANLLEKLSAFCVYREPVIWRRLTDLLYKPKYASRYSQQELTEISRAVFELFSRTWRPGEQAVVKSIPGAMGLDLVAHEVMPASRCIYLRPQLESYLAGVFRQEGPRMRWIEKQLRHEWLWNGSTLTALKSEAVHLPDHLKSALHWKLHTSAMERRQAKLPGSFLTINSEDFFRDKRGILTRVTEFFGKSVDQAELDDLLQSDAVNRYSKNSARRYDERSRLREEVETRSRHQAEIEEAQQWVYQL